MTDAIERVLSDQETGDVANEVKNARAKTGFRGGENDGC